MLSGVFWSLLKDLTMSFFKPKGTQESFVFKYMNPVEMASAGSS
jgi:hypothetical protein